MIGKLSDSRRFTLIFCFKLAFSMVGSTKRHSSSRYLLEKTSNISHPEGCTCETKQHTSWFFQRSEPSKGMCKKCQNAQQMESLAPQPTTIAPESISINQLMNYSRSSLSDVINPLSSEISTAKSDRILCFDKLSASVGLNSVISQLYGGPLEKVVYVSDDDSNIRIIQAHFFQAKDARAFYNFTKTGRFLVNGQVYYPHWANAGIANIYTLPKMIHDEMVYNGARRCLTLTRKPNSLTNSEVGTKLKHYNVQLNMSIDKIKKDFSKYGLIIAVCPLIAPTVSISIQFADVRCAIRTKKLFERQIDGVLAKNYSGWSISYGKDPTDRKCPTI